ncbi:MAG TPA: sigma-70 family RNA polymerase sigma factor, partial [Gemmataceae bacterium]|nr:sigma-70 family RNA polymerase sigma factor [Gemmataceae bacterium]
LNLCRRILQNEHHAEDAFQAAFLVFIRNARSIGKSQSVGSWLYKVAYRVACRVRATVPVLTNRMADLDRPASELDVDMIWRDLRFVLDQEIAGLSEHYRRPIVLCYLQGNTNEEAARLLGCPKGTVATRLARAREQLRQRLTRRGCVLSAGILTTVLTTKASALSLPAGLVRSTLAYASGKTAATLSGKVLSLSDGALRVMYINKMKIAAGVVLALVLAGTGVGLMVRDTWARGGPENAGPAGTPKVEPAKAPLLETKDQTEVAAKKVSAAGSDLYGDSLPEGAVARLGTVRFRQGAALRTSALSPDGRLLAGGVSTDIQIWDAETGKTLQRIAGPRSGGVSALVFSPDSRLLAALATPALATSFRADLKTTHISKLLICDVVTGRLVKQFDVKADDRGDPKKLGVMPAGGSKGKPVQLGERSPYLAFLPRGDTLLLTDGGPTVRLFDVASGELLRALETRSHDPPAIALTPDGQEIAVMEDDGIVRLWHTLTRNELFAIDKHKMAPNVKGRPVSPSAKMTFAPDGKLLATGSKEGVIFLWEVSTGKLLHTLEAHNAEVLGPINSLDFSPDGMNLLASHAKTMVVHLYLVLQVERDDLVNEGKRQRGKSLQQCLGRVALVVVVNHVLQADTVMRHVNVAVGVLCEKLRQCHGISLFGKIF